MSDRALAVVFFVSLALVLVVASAPVVVAICLLAVLGSGGSLVARGLRRGGATARRTAVVAGAIALLLALSVWYSPLAPLPALVAIAVAVRLRRDGERALLPLVLAGSALAIVATILVLAVLSL